MWAPGQCGIFSGSCQQWSWGLSLILSYIWHRHSSVARQYAFVKKHLIFHYFLLHLGFSFHQSYVFLHFSKGIKQTSLQSETSLSFLFPQETCFPCFQKSMLTSPCCWASQSRAREASKGTGPGGSCLQPESVWHCSLHTFQNASFWGKLPEFDLNPTV